MENFDLNSSRKTYEIDWDKVSSLEDVISILKPMNMKIYRNNNQELPDIVEALFDKGLLKEVAEENIFSRKKEL
jgi:hypothetical protein